MKRWPQKFGGPGYYSTDTTLKIQAYKGSFFQKVFWCSIIAFPNFTDKSMPMNIFTAVRSTLPCTRPVLHCNCKSVACLDQVNSLWAILGMAYESTIFQGVTCLCMPHGLSKFSYSYNKVWIFWEGHKSLAHLPLICNLRLLSTEGSCLMRISLLRFFKTFQKYLAYAFLYVLYFRE